VAKARTHRTLEGVVIHLRSMGESDRIVELLTRETGRIATLARGARASRKRFAGALDLFVSLRVRVIEGGSLWTLHAADILDARVGLRAGLDRLERAARLAECARVLTAEHAACPDTFAALVAGLDHLAKGEVAAAVDGYVGMLAGAGFLPRLERDERIAPAEVAVWRGGPCDNPALAAAVESRALNLVEQQIGRPLRTRRSLLVPRRQ